MTVFKGACALITGAAQGIGRAITLAFIERGENAALCDLRSEKPESPVRETAPAAKGHIFVRRVDLSRAAEVPVFAAGAEARLGAIDILANTRRRSSATPEQAFGIDSKKASDEFIGRIPLKRPGAAPDVD